MKIAAQRQAFTLVELLIVMAIMLLLAAVALPSVRTMLHGQKVTQASRMVQAHIEAARARAIASGSYVAVVLERQSNENHTTTRLSTGQVFPPYQGDITGATGVLSDTKGLNSTVADGYYDQVMLDQLYASLVDSGVFGAGDFIQFGDRESLFVIESWSKVGATSVIQFANPPYVTRSGTNYALQEPQLPASTASTVPFRIFRKPTKSFVQATVLPRGTCVDLSVSGVGPSGNEFFSLGALPVMIVFDERGTIAYVTDGTSAPQRVSGIVHLLVGRTEQVSTVAPLSIKLESDPSSFNANINDKDNSWVSINPYSGAVYSSAVQAGSEGGPLATRISVARSFATSATTRSVD
jgi:prepilin-type N-terminal cleavage/methylation domain-containing protein